MDHHDKNKKMSGKKTRPYVKKPKANVMESNNTIDFDSPVKKRVVNKQANVRHKVKKKNKNYKTKISYSSIAILLVFFFVVVIYIFGGVFEAAKSSDISTVSVEYGSTAPQETYRGIIIRDEKVYKSNATGTLEFKYDNYDMVNKGSTVCTIQNQTEVDKLNQELETSSEEILALQEQRGELSVYSREVDRANQQIQQTIDNSVRQLTEKSFSEVYTFKENVERSMEIRNQMILSEDKGSAKELVEENDAIEAQIQDNISEITAENSGILSYYMDGQEEALTFDNMNELTTEQTKMEVQHEDIDVGAAVVPEQSVFKIIESNDWYISLYVPNEAVTGWEVGDTRKIAIEKNGEFIENEMYVQEINKGAKESNILLKSSKNLIDYLNMRAVNVKLALSDEQGIKIPMSAIAEKTLLVIPNEFVNEEKEPSVTKKGDETSPDTKVPIKIYSSDETNKYVFSDENQSLNVSDVLLSSQDKTKEYTISEVKNVKGVFVYNNGYADFQEISMGENIYNDSGYVILDIEENKNLPVNSKILADPSNVKDGERLE